MKLRQDEGEAFQRFRLLLDQKFSAMRDSEDPEQVKIQAQAAMLELTELKADELESKLKKVKETLAIDVALASVGLAAAVQTKGWSLLSLAAAGLSAGRAFVDYRHDLKRNPSFFLWKLLRKSRRR